MITTTTRQQHDNYTTTSRQPSRQPHTQPQPQPQHHNTTTTPPQHHHNTTTPPHHNTTPTHTTHPGSCLGEAEEWVELVDEHTGKAYFWNRTSWSRPKRKRKRRRKRRTPRSSSYSSYGRARCRQRQLHACNAGFLGHVPLRAGFPSVVVRPKMLGIMTSMPRGVQKNWFFWEMTSYVSVSSSLVQQWIHIYVSLQRPGLRLQQTADSPQLQSIQVVDISFVAQRQFPMVQTSPLTSEAPQLPFVFRWSMALLCRSCLPYLLLSTTGVQCPQLQFIKFVDNSLLWIPQLQHSLWWSMSLLAARADSSLLSVEDSRDPTVAARRFLLPMSSSSLSWRRYRFLWSLTTEILQLQYIDKVIDVFVQVQHVVRSRGRQPSSHSCCSLIFGPVVACPLCATRDALVDDVAQFIDSFGCPCDHAET